VLETAMEAALNESAWRRQAPDLAGRWERDSTLNIEERIAFIQAHGHDLPTAKAKSEAPYAQVWRRSDQQSHGPGAWKVTTFEEDGCTPRRELTYVIGTFEEPFGENSCLFAGRSGTKGVAKRECSWTKADGLWSHVTTSETPLGKEETKRTVKPPDFNVMEVQRTFWPSGEDAKSVSATEIFLHFP
jgi:hypothetical protein